MRDGEWGRYWRILQWNQLANAPIIGQPERLAQCRTAWRQLALLRLDGSGLPQNFTRPLIAFRRGDAAAMALYQDDERLALFCSDLRDYVALMRLRRTPGRLPLF